MTLVSTTPANVLAGLRHDSKAHELTIPNAACCQIDSAIAYTGRTQRHNSSIPTTPTFSVNHIKPVDLHLCLLGGQYPR